MKRWLLAISALVFLSFSLTACSEDSDEESAEFTLTGSNS